MSFDLNDIDALMFLKNPRSILERIRFNNRALWDIWRQMGPISRGIRSQTGVSWCREDMSSTTATTSADAKSSSPDRKRPRTDVDEKMESTSVLKFSKITKHAFTPTKGSKLAAGFDLYSAYDYTIPARGKALALTDLSIALPDGCYGRVAPRSGLAHKHFIDVGAGVIDQDYRGNVGVVMFNFNDKEFKVYKGDRIAQLVCERIFLPELEEIQTLDKTERGAGGFGSTGVSLEEKANGSGEPNGSSDAKPESTNAEPKTNGTTTNGEPKTNGTTTNGEQKTNGMTTNGEPKTNGTTTNGEQKTNGTATTESKE